MSGTFPTSPVAASIRISSVQPSYVSVSHSLKRQTRTQGAQQWSIDIDYPPLSRADMMPVLAFAMKQQGMAESFTFTPPIYSTKRGTCSSCTSAVESAGATAVTVTMTGTLLAGDFVKFASHDKVYMVTDDLSGNGELNIQPPLLEDTTLAAVTVDNVPFKVAFASDVQEFSRGAADLHNYSASMVEVI